MKTQESAYFFLRWVASPKVSFKVENVHADTGELSMQDERLGEAHLSLI